MKILHTSDWHLGKVIYGLSLIDDQRYFIDNCFFNIIEEEQPDLIIIAGDIFDRAIASEDAISLFDYFITTVAEVYKVPIIIITGNHDCPTRVSVGSSLMSGKGIYIQSKISKNISPICFESNNTKINVYMLPYFEPSDARIALNDDTIRGFDESYKRIVGEISDRLDTTQVNILASHCFVTGSTVSDSERKYLGGSEEVGSSVFDKFDYVALGHIHKPQKAGKNGRYSGSPLAYSFDEIKSEKSITVLDIEGKDIKIRQVPIKPLHKMRVIQGTLDEIESKAWQDEEKDAYTCIKLMDTENKCMCMERLRKYFPNVLFLTNEYDNSSNYNVKDNYEEVKEFFGRGNDEEIYKKFMLDVCDIKEISEYELELFNEIMKESIKQGDGGR